MKKRAHQYTVRAVTPAVDRALRRKAAERGESLNAVLVRALEREAGLGEEECLHHDLDHLSGTWIKDIKVDRALGEQRTIDPRDWE
jgi:S-adenosylmethionine:diacylglycerol 3-amino-3-carboxypropyl transferase